MRLANHLADVHLLDIDQRRQYLQEAKLQPKIKFVDYQADEQSTRNYQIHKKENQNRRNVYAIARLPTIILEENPG